MPLSIKQLVEDESADRDYFAMVPAMLWPDIKLCSGDSDADATAAHTQELSISLNVHDRWLYVTLKKICGEKGGQCFMSSRGLAKFTGMSTGQLSKSKSKLEQAGLITIIAKKRSVKGWAIDHITVMDVWEQNVQLIKARRQRVHGMNTSKEGKCSRDEPIRSPDEQIKPKCSPHEPKCSPGETEEEPIEEEPWCEEKPKKKTVDPLSFDLERETLQGKKPNYAVPPDAGGADPFIDGPVDVFAIILAGVTPASLPPKERKSWARKLREIAKRWSTEDAPVTADDMERAIRAVPDSAVGWKTYTSPYSGNFDMDIGPLLLNSGRLCQKGASPTGASPEGACPCDGHRARDIEVMQASLAARAERQAASPPPADDAIGRQVKVQLEFQMGLNEFRQHVEPTRFICADGILQVTAPDEFTRDWLGDRLGLIIRRILVGIEDGPGEVRFEVEDDI